MGRPGFNIYEFKKWLGEHPSHLSIPDCKMDRSRMEADPIIGSHAVAKANQSKIDSAAENVNGNKDKIISEFLGKGGTTIKNHGKRVVIEVSCGDFSIPRFCVKLEKKK